MNLPSLPSGASRRRVTPPSGRSSVARRARRAPSGPRAGERSRGHGGQPVGDRVPLGAVRHRWSEAGRSRGGHRLRVFKPGSTWEIRATRANGGSRVEVIGVRRLRGDRHQRAPTVESRLACGNRRPEADGRFVLRFVTSPFSIGAPDIVLMRDRVIRGRTGGARLDTPLLPTTEPSAVAGRRRIPWLGASTSEQPAMAAAEARVR
jgi:hypothetical protein